MSFDIFTAARIAYNSDVEIEAVGSRLPETPSFILLVANHNRLRIPLTSNHLCIQDRDFCLGFGRFVGTSFWSVMITSLIFS